MTRIYKGASLLAALPLIAGLSAPALARDLVIMGPGGGYQEAAREHLFKTFTAETGIAVKDDAFDGELAKIYAMVDSGDVSQDIVMVGEPELLRGCEDGLFEKVDYTVVTKAKFLDGTALDCGIGGAGWGGAFFYDKNKHPAGPQTMAEFFDTAKFPGKRSLRASAQQTLEVALLADGVARDDIYTVLSTDEGVQRAFDKLDTIRKDIVWWTTGAQPVQFVSSGEADFAYGFTGRVLRAISQDNKDFELVWPTLLYSVDYWAVVSGSPKKDEAMKMMEWITSPGPLREQAKVWPISPAVTEIVEDPAIRETNPGMVLNHADKGLHIGTEFWVTNGETLEARFASWAAK